MRKTPSIFGRDVLMQHLTPFVLLSRIVLLVITITQVAGCGFKAEAETPVLKSELVVEDHDPRLLLGNFKWLDNDHILAVDHDHVEPLPKGGGWWVQRLILWDVRSNKTTRIHEPDVGGLCLMNGNIRFFTRKIDANAVETRQYHEGTLGNFKPLDLREPIDLVSCESEENRSFLPGWAQAILPIDIIRLKPEHGFIWIDRDDIMQKPRGLWLYPPHANKNQGIDISRIMGDYPRKNAFGLFVKYFPHQRAYSTYAFGVDWWIYPDGKLEPSPSRIKSNFDFSRKGASEDAPTQAGVVFGASNFTDRPIGDGGLFLRDSKLNIKRLTKGRITHEIEVSPDGCKVAYGNDRQEPARPTTGLTYKLEVINLCKEFQP